MPVSETIPEESISELKPAQKKHLTYRNVYHLGNFIDHDRVIDSLVHALAKTQ